MFPLLLYPGSEAVVERRLRLRREAEVRQARSRGKAWADGPLVARVLPNQTEPRQNRYTVVAGKRVGKAVQRNRLKRLVREVLRTLHPNLTPGHDVVVVVRGTVEEMPDLAAAEASLGRIVRRAGLLSSPVARSKDRSGDAGPQPAHRTSDEPVILPASVTKEETR